MYSNVSLLALSYPVSLKYLLSAPRLTELPLRVAVQFPFESYSCLYIHVTLGQYNQNLRVSVLKLEPVFFITFQKIKILQFINFLI